LDCFVDREVIFEIQTTGYLVLSLQRLVEIVDVHFFMPIAFYNLSDVKILSALGSWFVFVPVACALRSLLGVLTNSVKLTELKTVEDGSWNNIETKLQAV
jgi:hypothetical protein